jgi:multisubunit Na+/H+ antiporter MnhB subunit
MRVVSLFRGVRHFQREPHVHFLSTLPKARFSTLHSDVPKFPFKVTRAAAIVYAIYFGLLAPYLALNWGLVIGGAILLCIIAAIEIRVMWRRKRASDNQTAHRPAESPGAGSE